jgi:starvation-inducible DNA-binding protein
MATKRTLPNDGNAARLSPRRLALPDEARQASVGALIPLLADTMALRDLYKKHHWQASGPSFYELHQLYDKHYKEQVELMDEVAERIQQLGGESVAFPQHVAEVTRLPVPPRQAEPSGAQLRRLLDAHELILAEARDVARLAEDHEDHTTIDLVTSRVIPVHEEQVWFLTQQGVELSPGAEAVSAAEPTTRAGTEQRV